MTNCDVLWTCVLTHDAVDFLYHLLSTSMPNLVYFLCILLRYGYCLWMPIIFSVAHFKYSYDQLPADFFLLMSYKLETPVQHCKTYKRCYKVWLKTICKGQYQHISGFEQLRVSILGQYRECLNWTFWFQGHYKIRWNFIQVSLEKIFMGK